MAMVPVPAAVQGASPVKTKRGKEEDNRSIYGDVQHQVEVQGALRARATPSPPIEPFDVEELS